MSSTKKVSRTVVARDVQVGMTLRLVAPDGEDFNYEVRRVGQPQKAGVSTAENVRLTVHPEGFATTYTESRLFNADRELELVEKKTNHDH